MYKVLRLIEEGFTVFSLLIYSGGPLVLILSGGANENEVAVNYDTSLSRICFFSIYVVTFFLLSCRLGRALYLVLNDGFITTLLLLAPASLLWSDKIPETTQGSITLIGSSLFGIYLATRYDQKQQMYLLGWTFGIAVVLSILFAVGLPHYGLMGGVHTGAWRGIYIHKNGLGGTMAIAAIIFLLLANSPGKYRWLLWSGAGLSVVLILLSRSTTALFDFAVLIVAYFVLQILRWHYRWMVVMVCLTMLIGGSSSLWVVNNAGALLEPLGKDPTLTGRTDMWPFVMDMIWKHPWLGYGYDAFWHGWNSESAYIWRATHWNPTHPHNGLLALWIDLGLLGVIIFLFSFFRSLLKSLVFVRLVKTSAGIWPVLYIIYIVITNVAETNLIGSNNLSWILYISISLSLLSSKAEQIPSKSSNPGATLSFQKL